MTKPVTPKDIEEALSEDLQQLYRQIAKAVNSAKPGHIIADSEEPVRDSVAVFRQRLYQMALQIRQKSEEGAFSPSAEATRPKASSQQGPAEDKRCDG